MSTADGEPNSGDESRYGPRDPEQPRPPSARDAGRLPPGRKPWNTSGYIGLALCAVSFAGNVLVGWTGAVLLAALGFALCLTGLVRVYRARATNKVAVLVGLGLAVATFALQFYWSARAEPCAPLRSDLERYSDCYNEHAGIL